MTFTKSVGLLLALAGLSGCVDDAASSGVAAPLRMASAVDEAACVTAVGAKTNNSAVVMSSTTSEANNMVIVGVGSEMAQWKCLVNGGVVVETMSMVDEGFL